MDNSNPKVSLDQWRSLQAVIDYGGFAQAGEQLHRSQSSVSYAVNRLQEQLGLKLLTIKGRKAVLTKAGEILLERSRVLLADAKNIEQQAHFINQGWEAEITVAVEAAFPTPLLIRALKIFETHANNTRIRINEVVLSGAEQSILSGEADIAVSPYIPKGFLGTELLQVHFVAVAHPDHPLHKLNRPLARRDLEKETHIVLSDSGNKGIDSGWINDSRRWTVTSPESSIQVISNGLGYGWLPENVITEQLNNHSLKRLPMSDGCQMTAILHLIYTNYELAGPAAKLFADILKNVSVDAMNTQS